jgi:hypothetical protein
MTDGDATLGPAPKARLQDSGKNLPQRSYLSSETDLSRPAAAAALAIPGLAALIFSRHLQRHPRRLPSTGLRDRRQVDVELCEILRRP